MQKKCYPENFEIDELDMMGDAWKEYDFSQYDIIYHVAGIAHADVGNVSDETKEKYYQGEHGSYDRSSPKKQKRKT